ncbi:TetR family transcriptional regulator [Paenibacillus amylolyticus]|uniref:TetR family transcriptional regulator n=1 Tax=Paenibacillus amylolyticus TaxID=1451 RepID=A0A100VLN9_PAEAM|nr:TetR/AcrR family transcriptional regulator [Paenibacillus amylolyticus]OMF07377.1 TetR family transcriptional regulator [Paenibacillus amylolyticus]GAS82034.1 TetR family transcriptional regulator [Paenibacillus amylolyticus]
MNDELIVTSQHRNRTKEHLKTALIQLIKKKGFHGVSVKDIVDQAGYNRSTFYLHYQDKYILAEELLSMTLGGLRCAVGKPYWHGQKVLTNKLNVESFQIVDYIYEHRDFFELIQYDDTLPGLHTGFPQTILKIYQEQFVFETINNSPVNMDYFKYYTAYGFFGLLNNWILSGYRESRESFIKNVIELTKTHIHSFHYVGNTFDS